MSGTQVQMKLEVVVLPVSDVARAKRFYGSLGWSWPDWYAEYVVREQSGKPLPT